MRAPASIHLSPFIFHILKLAFLFCLIFENIASAKTPDLRKEEIEIEAKEVIYDWQQNILILEEDVKIRSGEDTLIADKAIFYKDINLLELFGDVKLNFRQDVLYAEYAKVDTKDKTGIVQDAKLFLKQNNLFLSGSLIEKTGNETYRIAGCKVTSCDGVPPAWHIRSSTVEVTVGGYGKAWNASLNAGGLPLLYAPVVIFPARTTRQSGLLIPRVGYSKHLGMDVEIPFFWNLASDKDMTFYQRYMASKGYMQGLEFRYAQTRVSKGAFMLDIMKEDKAKPMEGENLDISPYPRNNTTRLWFRGRVNQELPRGILMNSDLDLISDQDFLRELEPRTGSVKYRPDLGEYFKRPFDERFAPFRSNVLKLSKAFESEGYFQIMSSYYQVPERPALDTTPQPVFDLFGAREFAFYNSRLILDMEGTHRYILREEGQEGQVLKLDPKVKAAIPLLEYFTLGPYLRYDLSWWSYSHNPSDPKLEKAFEGGVGLSTSVFKDFALGWWGIETMRHNMIPRVELRYDHQSLGGDYPWFDEYQTIRQGKKLHFELENSFTGRIRKENTVYRRIASITVDQELVLAPGEGEKGKSGDLGLLNVSWVFEPKGDVEFRGDLKWDHRASRMETASVSAGIPLWFLGAKQDRISVSFQSEAEGLKGLNMDLLLSLPKGIMLGTQLSRDLRANQNVNSSYWIGYKHQCYGIKLVLDSSQNRTQIGLFVELLGLGEIGGKF